MVHLLIESCLTCQLLWGFSLNSLCIWRFTKGDILFYIVVMSEDMVKDGYEDIMNIDISSVAIEMMKRKYEYIPQLKCILLKELFQFLL